MQGVFFEGLKQRFNVFKFDPANDSRITQLDGLRGILALQVAFFHMAGGIERSRAAGSEYLPVLMNHWIAVDVFFAMSGFVMCYVYCKDFDGQVAWRDYLRFIWARFARIVPVNTVMMILFLIVILPAVWGTDRFLSYEGRYSWSSALAGLVMLQGPAIDHRTWNYPSWSVSVEWCLYFLFPFIPLFLKGRALAWIVMVLCCVGALVLYSQADAVTNGGFSLLRGGLLFASGVAIFRLWKQPLFESTPLMAAVVGGVLVLLAFPTVEFLAVLLVPFLILATLRNRILSSALSGPVCHFLGVVSYSLYMVHAFIQIVIANRIHDFLVARLGDSTALAFLIVALGLALSLLSATAMVIFVEKPARDYLRSLGTIGPVALVTADRAARRI